MTSIPLLALVLAGYVVSCAAMALISAHVLASWTRAWHEQCAPSLFAQWHPLYAPSWQDMPARAPTASDRRKALGFALAPVLNTALLIFLAAAVLSDLFAELTEALLAPLGSTGPLRAPGTPGTAD